MKVLGRELMAWVAFLVPANAMLAVELDHIAEMLEETSKLSNVSSKAREYSSRIRQAVWDTTISPANGVFAYETDGFGGMIMMDDGNVPVSPTFFVCVTRQRDTVKLHSKAWCEADPNL